MLCSFVAAQLFVLVSFHPEGLRACLNFIEIGFEGSNCSISDIVL